MFSREWMKNMWDATWQDKKWESRFLALAMHIAGWSKDPSTCVGAVIVDRERRVVGMGYNGFPRGVHDHDERYAKRELKYEMVVHAEVNAILNAVKGVRGCTLYSTFFPCPRCAAVIIQSGITQVVAKPNASDERYKAQFEISNQMFKEAGVRVG